MRHVDGQEELVLADLTLFPTVGPAAISAAVAGKGQVPAQQDVGYHTQGPEITALQRKNNNQSMRQKKVSWHVMKAQKKEREISFQLRGFILRAQRGKM